MNKKIPSLVLACTVALASTASAAVSIDSIGTNINSSTVTVKGSTDYPNENIIITVNSKDVSDSEFFDKLAYQNQIKTKDDGSFYLSFKMKGADAYTLTVSAEAEDAAKDFVFADTANVKSALERLNKSEDVALALKTDRYNLGLFVNGIDSEPNYSSLATRVKPLLPLSVTEENASVLALQRQLIYQYIAEKKVENVFDYDEYFDIFKVNGNDVFTREIFKQSHELDATARISGKVILNYDDFCSEVTEAMILSLVKNANGFGNVKSVLETHANFIGINTANTPDSVYKNLAENDFATKGALKDKFNFLKSPDDSDFGNSGGGKTSGGSGGKLSGGNVNITTDNSTLNAPFTDLFGYDWAKESIAKLKNSGIVSGSGDGRFLPAKSVTRSEFVKMICLALKISGGGNVTFNDVFNGSWDAEYVKAAFGAGIVNGISGTQFGGSTNITRQDMAVIIVRALTYAGRAPIGTSNEKFADDAGVASYAKDAVYALRAAGIMQGDENGNFNPTAPATRAEAAKVICAVLN